MFESWLLDNYNQFKQSLSLNHTANSIIIAGDPSLGISKLVLKIASLYLCSDRIENEQCGNCKSCQLLQVEENPTHPDLLFLLPRGAASKEKSDDTESSAVEPVTHSIDDFINDMDYELNHLEIFETGGVRQIRVEDVKTFCDWIMQGSVLANGKVAVISNAHLLNESAANALLKTFEEPPVDTLIILVAKSFDELPATILSRAMKMQVKAVLSDEAKSFLQYHYKDEYDEIRAEIALTLANNSPYKAIALYNQGLDLKCSSIISLIDDVYSGKKSENELIQALESTQEQQRYMILKEFILELLKYKARISIDNLPFMKKVNAASLGSIRAEVLFRASDAVEDLKPVKTGIPQRAPNSVLRSFVELLLSGRN